MSTSLSSSIVFIALQRFDRFKDRIRVDLKQQKTTDNYLTCYQIPNHKMADYNTHSEAPIAPLPAPDDHHDNNNSSQQPAPQQQPQLQRTVNFFNPNNNNTKTKNVVQSANTNATNSVSNKSVSQDIPVSTSSPIAPAASSFPKEDRFLTPEGRDTKDIIRGFVKTEQEPKLKSPASFSLPKKEVAAPSEISTPPPIKLTEEKKVRSPRNEEKRGISPRSEDKRAHSPRNDDKRTLSPRTDEKSAVSPKSEKALTPRKQDKESDQAPTNVQVVPLKQIKYSSRFTCFEWTLIVLNVLIFLGILFTLMILLRIFVVVHQKDINDFLAYLITLQ